VTDPRSQTPTGAPKPPVGAPVPPQAAPKPPVGAPVPPQAAPKPPVGAPAPQGQGALMGQLGNVSKPVPHIVRKKTGEHIYIEKPEFSIGKSKTKADYPLEDNPAISRVHCIIIQRNGVNYIKDNHSTNHTFLNGVELEPDKEMLLKHKSVIQMGDEEFMFLLRKGD
jgi:pSer/pThr/pTyr-binding forkhead associated (FHA) protein